MRALLVVAHGSRRSESNNEVVSLVQKIERLDNNFDAVQCAFLELAKPSIPEALKSLISAGAEQIIVVPYFLSAGRHVAEDVPSEVKLVKDEFPDIDIQLANYFGAHNAVAEILLAQATARI